MVAKGASTRLGEVPVLSKENTPLCTNEPGHRQELMTAALVCCLGAESKPRAPIGTFRVTVHWCVRGQVGVRVPFPGGSKGTLRDKLTQSLRSVVVSAAGSDLCCARAWLHSLFLLFSSLMEDFRVPRPCVIWLLFLLSIDVHAHVCISVLTCVIFVCTYMQGGED